MIHMTMCMLSGISGRKNTSGKTSTSETGKARDDAAKAVGTNPHYISDVKAIKARWHGGHIESALANRRRAGSRFCWSAP
jgi:hypothetical protein